MIMQFAYWFNSWYTHMVPDFIHQWHHLLFLALLIVSFSVNSCSCSLFSLNWQHQLCKSPKPNPDIKTLFTDHTCSPSNGARAPTPVNLPVTAVAKPSSYVPLGVHSGVRPFSCFVFWNFSSHTDSYLIIIILGQFVVTYVCAAISTSPNSC